SSSLLRLPPALPRFPYTPLFRSRFRREFLATSVSSSLCLAPAVRVSTQQWPLALLVVLILGVGLLRRLQFGNSRNRYVPPALSVGCVVQRVAVDVDEGRGIGCFRSCQRLFQVLDGGAVRSNFDDVHSVAARIRRKVDR